MGTDLNARFSGSAVRSRVTSHSMRRHWAASAVDGTAQCQLEMRATAAGTGGTGMAAAGAVSVEGFPAGKKAGISAKRSSWILRAALTAPRFAVQGAVLLWVASR